LLVAPAAQGLADRARVRRAARARRRGVRGGLVRSRQVRRGRPHRERLGGLGRLCQRGGGRQRRREHECQRGQRQRQGRQRQRYCGQRQRQRGHRQRDRGQRQQDRGQRQRRRGQRQRQRRRGQRQRQR